MLNEDISNPSMSVHTPFSSVDTFLPLSIVAIYNYIITSSSSYDHLPIYFLKKLTNTFTPIFYKIIIYLLNNC